jgi:organic radical activating enzyme
MRDKPYCKAPWLGLYYEGTVGCRPCCEWKHASFSGNYEDYTKSDYLKNFKQNMYNDEPEAGCIECTHNEKIGGHSRRKYYDKFEDIDFEQTGLKYIARMDFRAGNKCNMMCRMCGPQASSLLEEELIMTGEKHVGFQKHLDTSDVYGLDLSHCEEICILGGEPSIDLEIRKFMNHVADNYPHVRCVVTTNATNASKKWFDTLMKFCHGAGLQIILSVDAAGPTQDFQRKSNIKWNTIKKNLLKYRDTSFQNDGCEISIQLTCTSINMVTIDKWWDELVDLRIKLDPNQVWWPQGMAVSCIPPEVKEKSIEWLQNWKIEYVPLAFKSCCHPAEFIDTDHQIYEAVSRLINILKDTEFEGIEKFIHHTNRYDKIRNENIIELDERFKVMMHER